MKTKPRLAGLSALWKYKAIHLQAGQRAGQWSDGGSMPVAEKNSMKISIIRLLLIGLVTVFLSGCASGSRFTAAPQPPPGKALVYVYRKSSMVGVVGYDRIFVNHDFAGDLHSGGYCVYEMPAGTNVFYIVPRIAWTPIALDLALLTNFQNKQYEKLRFNAEAGKTYYVNVYISFTGHDLKLVEEATHRSTSHHHHHTDHCDHRCVRTGLHRSAE